MSVDDRDASDPPFEDRAGRAQAILDAVLASHGGQAADDVRSELKLRMLSVGIDWPPTTLDLFASKISSGQGIALGMIDGNRA